MQFTRGIRVDKFQKEKKTANQLVSLYTDAPQEELTLDEFELSALDRLQLLRGIEIIQARGYDGKEFTDRLTAVREFIDSIPLSSHLLLLVLLHISSWLYVLASFV